MHMSIDIVNNFKNQIYISKTDVDYVRLKDLTKYTYFVYMLAYLPLRLFS